MTDDSRRHAQHRWPYDDRDPERRPAPRPRIAGGAVVYLGHSATFGPGETENNVWTTISPFLRREGLEVRLQFAFKADRLLRPTLSFTATLGSSNGL